MAFGLSGSDTNLQMAGSDIVVADYKENREARAIDYSISGYSPVRSAILELTNRVDHRF